MTASHSREPRRSRPRSGIPHTRHEVGHGENHADDHPSASVRPSVANEASPAFDESVRVSPWVRVTCPTCGVVRVRPDQVVLRVCMDDLSWAYRAHCSECDATFLGVTPSTLALPAVAAGLVVESWSYPAPSGRRGGDTLSEVDALDLHMALLEPDWLEQMEQVDPIGD